MDIKELEGLLATVQRSGATSLHLMPGKPPAIRLERRFVAASPVALASSEIEELTKDFMFEDHRRQLADQGQVEVLYVARSGQRFRTTVMLQAAGVSLMMHAVPSNPPQLAELELPPQMQTFTQFRSGIVLLTGCFGSGKSSTQAALIDALSQGSVRTIVTIEDPIEYIHTAGSAVLHQREVGVHVETFAEGIAQAVRLGVDVVSTSEIRDLETLEALLAAAEGGCLCIATLDSASIVGGLTRLFHLAAPEARPRLRTRLANQLRAMSSQTLLPRALEAGRVPLVEVLVGNSLARAAIRQGNLGDLEGIMTRSRGLGMQTTDLALRGLLGKQLITPEDAAHYAIAAEPGPARVGVSALTPALR
jgi:twitching motility protein PilT